MNETETMIDYTLQLDEITEGINAIYVTVQVFAVITVVLLAVAFLVWLSDKFIDV